MAGATWIDALGKVVLAGIVFWPLAARFIKRRRSNSWPVTTGRIETFEIRRDHVPRSWMTRVLCQSGYSYTVDGSYYSGSFALHAATEAVVSDADEAAEELGRSLIGRTLEIRYNPKLPEDSIPVQQELEGRRIEFL